MKKNIGGNMGRKRKYHGNTEAERINARVKAFRERKKLQGITRTTASKRILRSQKTYETYSSLKRILEKEISCTEYLFLNQKEQKEEFLVLLRCYDGETKKTSVVSKKFNSLDKAEEEFKKVSTKDRENFWLGFESTREQVKGFIKSYTIKKEKDFLWGNKHYSFRFLAMLNEVVETEGIGPLKNLQKNLRKSSDVARQWLRREMVSILSDVYLDPNATREELKLMLEDCCARIIVRTLENNNQTARSESCASKLNLFNDIIKTIQEFGRVYDPIQTDQLLQLFVGCKIQALNCFKKRQNGKDYGLTEVENNPFIPIKELTEILDIAWDKSTHLYYFIILSLSIGAREYEMRRIIGDVNAYVLPDGTLDYNNSKKRTDFNTLIQKTVDATDITALVNPRLSIVSRMILFHETPRPFPEAFFVDKIKGFRKNPHLADYHERTLRTTCATMLAYCDKLQKQGRATMRDVQTRLGHINMTMAMEIYAKTLPSDESPVQYFGVTPKTIINDYDLTQNSSLWDTWLLKNYLKKKEEYFKLKQASHRELQEFHANLLSEAESFNHKMRSEDDAKVEELSLEWLSQIEKKVA